MKKLFLMMSVLFIVSCSKKDIAETTTSNSDSLASDSSVAIPNPAPQTDSTSATMPSATTDSASSSGKKDSAR